MAYEIYWQQENRVIGVRLWGDTSVQELRSMSADMMAYLDAGVSPIHSITDITQLRKFPPSVIAIKGAAPHINHPNLGWSIVVGGPALAQSFVQIVARVASLHYYMCRTVDESLNFLTIQDATLAKL